MEIAGELGHVGYRASAICVTWVECCIVEDQVEMDAIGLISGCCSTSHCNIMPRKVLQTVNSTSQCLDTISFGLEILGT